MVVIVVVVMVVEVPSVRNVACIDKLYSSHAECIVSHASCSRREN